jgi:adenylate kinase
VCLFEQPEEESIRRISNRRIDPNTGVYYNLEVFPPKDEATASRLIELAEDKEKVVR